MRDSLRWRLPLSYAFVALLTCLSLAAILLFALRAYYDSQEQAYLDRSAASIAARIAPFFDEELPVGALASQAEGYAFLTGARVRFLDKDDRVLADSAQLLGLDAEVTLSAQVKVGSVTQAFSQTIGAGVTGIRFGSEIVVSEDGTRSTIVLGGQASGDRDDAAILPVRADWLAAPDEAGGLKSNQEASARVYRLIGGEAVGAVALSEGPAYGQAILRQVALASAAAGMVALVIAATAGWFVSRHLTAPLADLNAMAERMMAGDLSARVKVERRDELGNMARAFNRMGERIEENIATLRQFVSDAAHELRTPLTALRSDLDLIEKAALPQRHASRIERAQTQVARLETVTEALLTLSRAEALPIQPQPVDLTEMLSRLAEPAASRAEQAGQRFKTQFSPTPLFTKGDEGALRRAIENLLDNAIKYNRPDGSVTLSLWVDAQWAVVSVMDTGVGIPDDELPQVALRFQRGRRTTDIEGTGLGLAITKAIADAHGGQLSLESGHGETRVSLRLPLLRSETTTSE